ncbi:Membrane protein, conserved [Thermococcus camini]|uniref:Membrane protein, conserved n=2 Tax=Thermococcus camini TaxID=2016373 RepID=A0A7G2D621_9EURY|nr:Membrane protein, conserved [Thermococcus camini]
MEAGGMKKAVALILLGLMVFSLTPVVHLAKSATVPKSASITGVSLGLKDKAVLGPFEVQFVDVNPNWSKIYLQVDGPQGSLRYVVSQDGYLLYPSSANVYLNVSLVWIRYDTKSVLLEIKSPLQKILSNRNMVVGNTLTLPEGFPQIKIKLTSVSGDTASFKVTMPYGDTYTLTVDKGSAGTVRYKLDGTHSYSNYLTIEVTNTVSNGATINVYIPKIASTSFKIVKEGQDTNPPEQNPQETVLVYNGLIYVNEKLPVKVENTTYYVKLVSAIPDVAKVEILRGSQSLGTMLLEVGDVPKDVPKTPLRLSVQGVEPDYKRATLRVYAPLGAEVTPILRQANLVADISAIPREMMLTDSIVVTINVQNLGRGDAYDVSVAAPIPNDFELISMTKTWNLKAFPAFTNMPALIYVLKPTKVGEFDIGKATVTFYDDKSLETGKKRVIHSAPLTGIKVYNVPSIDVSAQAYNGTWSNYVTAKVGDKVSLRFTLRASDGNPDYEFVKNATLLLDLPSSVDGQALVDIGTIRAGETKTLQLDLTVLKENLTNIKATLVYLDPLGGEHRLTLGSLVTINSIPPRIITEEVKVWPTAEELPSYVNQTLAKMDDPKQLAEELAGISAEYLPPESNPWKPAAIVFILLTVILAGVAYRYWDEAEKLKEKLERRKQRRPGGLPKKEGEEEGESSEIAEL